MDAEDLYEMSTGMLLEHMNSMQQARETGNYARLWNLNQEFMQSMNDVEQQARQVFFAPQQLANQQPVNPQASDWFMQDVFRAFNNPTVRGPINNSSGPVQVESPLRPDSPPEVLIYIPPAPRQPVPGERGYQRSVPDFAQQYLEMLQTQSQPHAIPPVENVADLCSQYQATTPHLQAFCSMCGDASQPRQPECSSCREECPICLDSVAEGDISDCVDCPNRHRCHKHCITEWMKTSASCPVCKFQFQCLQ